MGYIATLGPTENIEFFQTMTVITNLNIKDVNKDNTFHIFTIDGLEV